MPDEGSSQDSRWPVPAFSFRVSFGSLRDIPFQEVSGLDTETPVIESRHGDSPAFPVVKMPGLKKYGNVTLKRGLFAKDDRFWDWYRQISTNSVPRSDVVVQLVDEGGDPTMTWTLKNAWPTKVTAPTPKSDGNDVAIQAIEFAHEGLAIANG